MGLEVLRVLGSKVEKSDSFGHCKLYSEGTERIVKKYFLFPRNINGVKVRGSWIVKQVCEHDTAVSTIDFDVAISEKWRNKEAIEPVDPRKNYDLIYSLSHIPN